MKVRREKSARPPVEASTPAWTFLSNHAHVLICLRAQPDMTVRSVAARVGITERAVQRIIADLGDAGFLTWRKFGRQNVYTVHGDRPLRHPVEAHRTVADLLDMVLPRPRDAASGANRARSG